MDRLELEEQLKQAEEKNEEINKVIDFLHKLKPDLKSIKDKLKELRIDEPVPGDFYSEAGQIGLCVIKVNHNVIEWINWDDVVTNDTSQNHYTVVAVKKVTKGFKDDFRKTLRYYYYAGNNQEKADSLIELSEKAPVEWCNTNENH